MKVSSKVVAPRGAGVGRVVAEVGGDLDAALAGQVAPGAAVLGADVERVDQHQRLAGAARRAGVGQLDAPEGVGRGLGVVPERVFLDAQAFGREGGAAAGVDVQVAVLGLVGLAVEAHQVVPHRLVAGLRDREREAGVRAFDRAAFVQRLGRDRVLRGVVGDPLREGDAAVRRVDVDAERRVLLHQRLGALGQRRGVLGHVLGVDRQARLVAREGVRADAVARLVAGRRRGQAAGVGGDRAVLVGGLLGADRRERAAEGLGFLGGDAGERRHRHRDGRHGRQQLVIERACLIPRSEGGLEGQADEAAVLQEGGEAVLRRDGGAVVAGSGRRSRCTSGRSGTSAARRPRRRRV